MKAQAVSGSRSLRQHADMRVLSTLEVRDLLGMRCVLPPLQDDIELVCGFGLPFGRLESIQEEVQS